MTAEVLMATPCTKSLGCESGDGVFPLYREWVAFDTGARFPS